MGTRKDVNDSSNYWEEKITMLTSLTYNKFLYSISLKGYLNDEKVWGYVFLNKNQCNDNEISNKYACHY